LKGLEELNLELNLIVLEETITENPKYEEIQDSY
jgi:hypothetical protein